MKTLTVTDYHLPPLHHQKKITKCLQTLRSSPISCRVCKQPLRQERVCSRFLRHAQKLPVQELKGPGGNRTTCVEAREVAFCENLINRPFEHIERLISSFKGHGSAASRIFGGLKFIFLLGLLVVQGSYEAAAATEIAAETFPSSFIGDIGDISTGFVSAFLLIFFSELGDKTFFIAALLAARNSGAVVFTGTFGALAAMTVVSVILGRTFHYIDGILPFRLGESDLPLDDIAAVFLLVYFGVMTLVDAASGNQGKADEEQKEAELAVSKLSGNGAGVMTATSTVISTFALVFVAEWGDKSFFSTIALAAASSPFGVIGGSLAGHAVATLIAVLGGSLLGSFLSEKVIGYMGGSLFLLFAILTLAEIMK